MFDLKFDAGTFEKGCAGSLFLLKLACFQFEKR